MNWFDEYRGLNCSDFLEIMRQKKWDWTAKRLSGNDTNLTGGHQAGLYLPKTFIEKTFPEIITTETLNPDSFFDCYFPADNYFKKNVRAIYYNNKFFIDEKGKYGTRNEFRLTQWGGQKCALQNKENTGTSLILFWANQEFICWVAQNDDEEALIQNFVGDEIDPGSIYFKDTLRPIGVESEEERLIHLIPESWTLNFPTSKELAYLAIDNIPFTTGIKPDAILLKRRELETALFYEVERLHFEPTLKKGFSSIEDFVSIANKVTNRRKARSGRSLELHLSQLFLESDLKFEEQGKTELNKRPDFLFPSSEEYKKYPANTFELFMLAAKTCCKDRWRQVTSEADKIENKHLFTLQEGVSENQIAEMLDQKIHLVIPEKNRKSFPKTCQENLLNLSSFIEIVKETQQ